MKRIWKYQLKIIDLQTISIPKDHQFLCVKDETKHNPICLYAMVDDTSKKEQVDIAIFGTDHCFEIHAPKKSTYIGTAAQMEGQFVWHVFAEIK